MATIDKPTRGNSSLLIFVLFLIVALALIAWQVIGPFSNVLNNFTTSSNRETVEVSMIYSLEMKEYLDASIQEFNSSFEQGLNPVTGQRLDSNAKKIKISAIDGPTGTTKQNILNALNGQNTTQTSRPVIFAPSSRAWLNLINFESGQTVFEADQITPTTKTPVGIAIWESRLNALKTKTTGEIGYQEILQISQSPQGWHDYNPSFPRRQVYFGVTDPLISSTANSNLIAEYYAAGKILGQKIEQLAPADIQNQAIQDEVRRFQQIIRHYASNTIVFRDYIRRGPDYIDMVPLPENDVAYINRGQSEQRPPEKLVMLYPKEGSVIHEHPLGILNASWVSEEQKQAAKLFAEYTLTDKVQTRARDAGFRPASTRVPLDTSRMQQDGLSSDYPKVILPMPNGEALSRIQNNWNFIKKPARIVLLVDTSGSMAGEKMETARKALQGFIDKTSSRNEVALISFDSTVKPITEFQSLESGQNAIRNAVNELTPQGSTALYAGLELALKQLEPKTGQTNQGQTQAIILLSDGQDTVNPTRKPEILKQIEDSQTSDNPILIIPIAYGADAETATLGAIARASKTTLQTGQTKDIQKLLETLSSYF